MSNIIVIVSLLINLLLINNIILYLVTNFYDIKRLLLFRKKKIFENKYSYALWIIGASGAITCYLLSHFIAAIIINVLVEVVFVICEGKLKIVMTNRSKRLMFLTLIMYCAISYFIVINYLSSFLFMTFFMIFDVLIVIAALYISLPCEILIRKHYLKKARKKLRDNTELIIIGITGSYGKTTMKNFIFNFLPRNATCLIPGNINTLMGITRFINESLSPFTKYLIVEIGVDKVGGMKKFRQLLSLDYAVITSIGSQHLATFKTLENIKKEKIAITKLLNPHGILFYNSEYMDAPSVSAIDFNIKKEDILFDKSNGATFKIDKQIVTTKLISYFQVVLSFGAYLIAKTILSSSSIKKFSSLSPSKNRTEVRDYRGILLLDDSYNINYQSFINDIEILSRFNERKAVITRGLVETGSKEKEYNLLVSKELNCVDLVIIIRSLTSPELLSLYTGEVFYYHSVAEALEFLANEGNYIVLLTAIPNDDFIS